MLKIREYTKVDSLGQAYELNQKNGSVILGGMLWLKMQDRIVSTAIDLSGLDLAVIKEDEEGFQIGAMVTLRQLEQHAGLHAYTQGAMRESLRHIVGVQFRNSATVGGSIFGRFGFSDVLTAFMAMDTYVELYKGEKNPIEIIPLEEFAEQAHKGDILVRIIIKKQNIAMKYLSQRNTSTDFPTLTCAVAKSDTGIKCVVGARPQRAVCIPDKTGILAAGITEESAVAFAEYVQEQIVTGSNMRAGGAYRKKIAGVLVGRALQAF